MSNTEAVYFRGISAQKHRSGIFKLTSTDKPESWYLVLTEDMILDYFGRLALDTLNMCNNWVEYNIDNTWIYSWTDDGRDALSECVSGHLGYKVKIYTPTVIELLAQGYRDSELYKEKSFAKFLSECIAEVGGHSITFLPPAGYFNESYPILL